MARYIDAEIAEKSLRQYAEQKHANEEIELANGILKAVCKLKTLPAADVKEVVRGKWNEVVFPTTLDPCSYEYRCSNCNALSDDRYDKFCPDCGAEMKGVE